MGKIKPRRQIAGAANADARPDRDRLALIVWGRRGREPKPAGPGQIAAVQAKANMQLAGEAPGSA